MRNVLTLYLFVTMLMIKSNGAYAMDLDTEKGAPSCLSRLHSQKARHQQNTKLLKLSGNDFLEEYNALLSVRNQKRADLEKDVLVLKDFVKGKAEKIEESFQELCAVQESLQSQKRSIQEGENSKGHTSAINKQTEWSETDRLKEFRQRHTYLFLSSLFFTFEIQRDINRTREEIKSLDQHLVFLAHKIALAQELKNEERKQ